ncbi:N/A [soil metagenome]
MRYFITGTDTSVGKTLVAAALTLATRGCYWKPIQSGVAVEAADLTQVKAYTQLPHHHFLPSRYTLQAPYTPSQAALLENIDIDLTTCLLPKISSQCPATKALFVEGAGGIYSPLTTNACIIDYIQMLGLPVIIVSRGTLGTINHTLLTIAALHQRNIPIKGIIFSGELHVPSQLDIERLGGVTTLFHLPAFTELTSAILQAWVAKHRNKILQALENKSHS